VWFVGGRATADGRLAAKLEGTKIRRERVPPGPALWWLWGADAEAVWTAGEGGTILRLRGGVWVEVETGLESDTVLFGIWGSSRTDLWAVGGVRPPRGPKSIVLRSSGDGVWTRIEDSNLPPDRNLFKVWGPAADDVFLVGEGGVTLHFDGSRFRRSDVEDPALLFTVHGRAGGPVIAVGGWTGGLVLRWTRAGWVGDGAPEGLPDLNGIYVRADGSAVASGERGEVLWRDPAGVWREGTVEGDTKGYTFHAVWGGDDVWAVGGDFTFGGQGVIATSRRPLPEIDPDLLTIPDAGVRLDAEVVDLGPPPHDAGDAGVGLELPDAESRDGESPDTGVRPDLGVLPGPGERCPRNMCAQGLQCWLFVFATGNPTLCTQTCSTPADCGSAYGVNPCCIIPGPQLAQTYCLDRRRMPSCP
jgi:hypothetical protein